MTEKLALNEYPIRDLIRSRWSLKAFGDRRVVRDKMFDQCLCAP
ncbi:MAG: hypothetical protein RMY28_017380 [Nostoc sp. ChiSLP01]|nr:hypothetical protein [Nostoc sp. CmiSLP01]MDZ8286893.1 hypothetical protein [Nostoc sp. ChiSLP01]